MSRAGKYPVKLKDGVTVAIADNALVVKGPKGELKLALDTKNANLVNIAIEEGQVVITPKDSEDKAFIEDVSSVLLDQALLVGGAELTDPADFVKRMNKLITR